MNKEPKTIEQMFDAKHKAIQRMADRKLNAMEQANVLNAAKDLIIAFPDNWKAKLDDLVQCASFIVDIKEDNFLHTIEQMKKLHEGGILHIGPIEEQRQNLNPPPFTN